MKLLLALICSVLAASNAWAVPTGTVVRSVITDSNNVFVGEATNIPAANGLATTGLVSGVSNLAASALSTGVAAVASVDVHATNVSAHALLFAGKVGTNDATYTDTVAKATTSFSWGNHSTNNYLKSGATGAVFSGTVSLDSVTNSGTSVVFYVAIELPNGTYLLSDSYVKMSGLPGMPVWSGYLWNSNGHVMVSP